jgi:hypothetical protein
MYPAPAPVFPRHRPAVSAPFPALPQPVGERPPRARRPGQQPARARLDFSGEHGARLRTALTAVQEVCPDFVPAQVLRHSGRSVLLAGSIGRRPVVAKYALSAAATERMQQEIAAYRIFVRHRPPVRVPRLVGADSGSGTLVLEFVPGRAVAARRYPAAPLGGGDLRAVFAATRRLGAWTPPPGAFGTAVSYSALLGRYHSTGLLTDRDVDDLQALLHGLRIRPGGLQLREFCHGAAFPSQMVLSAGGPALLDWSSAGWYLPGRDLATLWAVLGESPGARRQISQVAQQAGPDHRDAFLVNLTLVLTREIRRCEEAVQRAMRAPETDGAAAARAAGGMAFGEEQRLLLRRLHEDCALTRRAVRAAVGTR